MEHRAEGPLQALLVAHRLKVLTFSGSPAGTKPGSGTATVQQVAQWSR